MKTIEVARAVTIGGQRLRAGTHEVDDATAKELIESGDATEVIAPDFFGRASVVNHRKSISKAAPKVEPKATKAAPTEAQ